MQYFGGKHRIGKVIAQVIQPFITDNTLYYEPFCGSLSVTQHIRAIHRYCSDANAPLIAMWQAIQCGWLPPITVTEDDYRNAKAGLTPDYLTAFIGFGCSFGGKWFGGYARGASNRNYARNAYNSIMRKRPTIVRDITFSHADYRTLTPTANKSVIYCDPPYQGTTQYGAVGNFDSTEFWEIMRAWGRYHTVIISEYQAPSDFTCIAEIPTKTDIRTIEGKVDRTERLFLAPQ